MRPKKKILLVGENVVTTGILKFLLQNNRYAVTVAYVASEALACMADQIFGLIICEQPVQNMEVFIREAKSRDPYTPLMLIYHNHRDATDISAADARLFNPPSGELLERVKVMSQRKRGPRKGTVPCQKQDPVLI